MIKNKPEFLPEFVLVINELGGKVIYPRVIKQFAPKIIVHFNFGNNIDYYNRVYLQIDSNDDETGVLLCSNFTYHKFVYLSEYMLLLISQLENKYNKEFIMKPRVAYYYLKGIKELQSPLN